MKASLLATISVYILLELSLLIFFFIFSTAENIGALCLILQVKNDDLRRTVLNSVVGTLDVCVRHPLHGEKFPEVGYNCTLSYVFFLLLYLEVISRSYSQEPGKLSLHCRIYQPDQPKFGYVTNVCVAKYARRQGIASNMLLLAIDAARLNGTGNIELF
jgi:ribosomal protein S18 acetylase RimI-like enzyme